MSILRNDRTPIMHRSVEHNGVVYLGGVVAGDRSVAMKGQTRQITERLDALLAAAGTDKSKILQATLYITDMRQKDAMNEAWNEWLAPAELPARATLGVADLGPGTLIEVVVVAAK